MTDQPQFDPKLVEELAEAKATAKMEELKANLVTSLSGQQPDKAPESWSSFKNETVETAVKQAEDRILSKIESDKKAQETVVKAQVQLSESQRIAEQNREWTDMTNQWKDAVADGVLPDIAPEIKKKLESGVDYNKLTPEEQGDEGLVAYNNARAAYIEQKRAGKSNSFYRTAFLEKNKKPAGASAPVFGATAATSQRKGYTYDEIHRENQRENKWR